MRICTVECANTVELTNWDASEDVPRRSVLVVPGARLRVLSETVGGVTRHTAFVIVDQTVYSLTRLSSGAPDPSDYPVKVHGRIARDLVRPTLYRGVVYPCNW